MIVWQLQHNRALKKKQCLKFYTKRKLLLSPNVQDKSVADMTVTVALVPQLQPTDQAVIVLGSVEQEKEHSYNWKYLGFIKY